MISLSYLEIPTRDMALSKNFFSALMGWTFENYGDEYMAFTDKNVSGGFYKSDIVSSTAQGGSLIVFYTEELEKYQNKIRDLGATIVRAIFEFPGGKRFHFTEPGGSEFAVWTDKV